MSIVPTVIPAEGLQKNIDEKVLFKLITSGDCAGLSEGDKLNYYHAICDAYDLDIRGTPFRFIRVQDKEILYATADCSKQLASKRVITVKVSDEKIVGGIAVAHATASLPNGQSADDIGAVPVENLKGKDLANAFMKAVTKAKRRATLSICGIGLPDESELETMEVLDLKPPLAPSGATAWLAEDKKVATALPPSAPEPPTAPATPPPQATPPPAAAKEPPKGGKADPKGKKGQPPPPARPAAAKPAAQPPAAPPPPPAASIAPPQPPPAAQTPGTFKFGPQYGRSDRVKEIGIVVTVNPKHVMDHILRFGGATDFQKMSPVVIEAILLATEAFVADPATRQGMATMIANQEFPPALLTAFTNRLKEEKDKLTAVTGRT